VKLVGFRTGHDLAAAFEPVLGCDPLDLRYHRSLDARHHVAPHRLAVRGLRPPVGHAGTADERHPAVDDEKLAVGAVVQAAESIPREPLVRLDPAPRLAEGTGRLAERAETADGVHHEGDAYTSARP